VLRVDRWIVATLATVIVVVTGCGWFNLSPAMPTPQSVISRAEFEQIFPGHSPFYSYCGSPGSRFSQAEASPVPEIRRLVIQ
jgi:hypothetical protein